MYYSKMDNFIFFTLPKSITSVSVPGKPIDVYRKVNKWLETVSANLEIRNVHLHMYVPIESIDTVDKNSLKECFGDYKIFGHTAAYPSGKIKFEHWEFNITEDEIENTLATLKNKESELKKLNPVLNVSYDFNLKNSGLEVLPVSSIILGLKNRSYVMPHIVFHFDETPDFYAFFEDFCSDAPFKLKGKYLRKVKVSSRIMTGKKLIAYR